MVLMGNTSFGMPKNKIQTPQCEKCRYFLCHISYKSDGLCLKDNCFTRSFRVCDKLQTDNERREAKKV